MQKHIVNNAGEKDYQAKVEEIAQKLKTWSGPIVLIAHIDPDGDALGSTLSLKRALQAMGKSTTLAMDVPKYLEFITHSGEIVKEIENFEENTLLVVMDVDISNRAVGAPLEGADFVINVDHHGSNARLGDISLVQPSKAAAAIMSKDIIDALGVSWNSDMATAALTGIITDTGNFRYSNTNSEVLEVAAELLAKGVDYATLTDRLQWRHPDYFKMLALVLATLEFPFDGLVAMANLTPKMEESLSGDDDSNDYVGLIRYAEGTKVAVFIKEREDHCKISVRTRDGVSAQNICLALGGGGHIAAAGAKIDANLEETKKLVLEQIRLELIRNNLLT